MHLEKSRSKSARHAFNSTRVCTQFLHRLASCLVTECLALLSKSISTVDGALCWGWPTDRSAVAALAEHEQISGLQDLGSLRSVLSRDHDGAEPRR